MEKDGEEEVSFAAAAAAAAAEVTRVDWRTQAINLTN
jgi:hypothetical protein